MEDNVFGNFDHVKRPQFVFQRYFPILFFVPNQTIWEGETTKNHKFEN